MIEARYRARQDALLPFQWPRSPEDQRLIASGAGKEYPIPKGAADVSDRSNPLSQSCPPFYLASTPRSGATLLAAMLDQHPSIAMFNEPWFFQLERKYGSLRRRGNVRRLLADLAEAARGFGAPVEDRLLQEIEEEILASGERSPLAGFTHFLDRYAASRGRRRWGIKQPHGILSSPRLLAHRPDTRFVHIVRDPRATVAYRMGKPARSAENLTAALRFARSWQRLCTFAERIPALGPHNYLEVRYEDLIDDTAAALRRVCTFLGETYDAAMLDYHRAEKSYVPRDPEGRPRPTHAGVLQPVYTHEVDSWRKLLSPRELELVEHVCREPMAVRGYRPAAGGRRPPAARLAATHLRLRWRLMRSSLRIEVLMRLFHLGRRAVTALLPGSARKDWTP